MTATHTAEVTLGRCTDCDGAGKYPHQFYGQSYKCSYCDGLKFVNAQGRAFRSERGVAQAKRARPCRSCEGTGRKAYPEFLDCTSCMRTGLVVTEAHVGQTLPLVVGIHDTARGEVMATLAEEFRYSVRAAQPMSQMATMLGGSFGGRWAITTVVDYGDRWDRMKAAADGTPADRKAAIDALIAEVKADLTHVQFSKFTDSETRKILSDVLIAVSPNGMTVTAVDA